MDGARPRSPSLPHLDIAVDDAERVEELERGEELARELAHGRGVAARGVGGAERLGARGAEHERRRAAGEGRAEATRERVGEGRV